METVTKLNKKEPAIKTYVIDLFCGFGGVTLAIYDSGVNMEVIFCINHDKNAILSHALNFPQCEHFTEDIRTINLIPIQQKVRELRRKDPTCKIAIHASLECTNYSKAKGGLPRDGDSRTLAEHLIESEDLYGEIQARYIPLIDPDFVWIENVREFMAWGPLDEKGKPVSRLKGQDYQAWVKKMCSFGYTFDWKLMNAADHGGYTTRTRYFAQFAKDDRMIGWEEPTHSKKPEPGKEPWKPVKEVLDLEDEGVSIFAKKKEPVENTLKRILAGLIKFVANGDEEFIQKYFSGRPMGKVISINGPAGTVPTVSNQAIVKTVFLTKYYGTGKNISGSDEPCGTVTTKDRFTKVDAQFFTHYYSGGGDLSSINKPHPTLTVIPKSRLMNVDFIDNQYGNSKPQSTDKPASTVTANPKQALVIANKWILNPNYNNKGNSIDKPCPTVLASRKHYYMVSPCLINKNSSTAPPKSIEDPCPTITQRTHYLMNPQWFNKGAHSVENPCFTLIARMDKAPPYVVTTETEMFAGILVYENDNPTMIKIKQFMAAYGIVDIKMRMLNIPELLQIQGFPKDYKMVGTKTEQKKFIGNAVEKKTYESFIRGIDKVIQLYG